MYSTVWSTWCTTQCSVQYSVPGVQYSIEYLVYSTVLSTCRGWVDAGNIGNGEEESQGQEQGVGHPGAGSDCLERNYLNKKESCLMAWVLSRGSMLLDGPLNLSTCVDSSTETNKIPNSVGGPSLFAVAIKVPGGHAHKQTDIATYRLNRPRGRFSKNTSWLILAYYIRSLYSVPSVGFQGCTGKEKEKIQIKGLEVGKNRSFPKFSLHLCCQNH